MPLTLHPHLKRGWDFEDVQITPDDRIEKLVVCDDHPQGRAAKQRRVEAIASRYLRGTPPLILSARLKGPFSNGWKNPWAENIPETREPRRRNTRSTGAKSGYTKKDINQGAQNVKKKSQKRNTVVDNIKRSHQASSSPEVSRRAGNAIESNGQDEELDGIEVPPATIPSRARLGPSVDTAPLVEDTEDSVHNSSQLKDTSWLRRSKHERHSKTTTSTYFNASPTSTRLRRGVLQPEGDHDLRLASPRPLLCNHLSSLKVNLSVENRTSNIESEHSLPRHNLITSPAPTSSSGFMYRKVGNSRRNGANATRSNPQHENSSTARELSRLDPKQRSIEPETLPGVLKPEAVLLRNETQVSFVQHVDEGAPGEQDVPRSDEPRAVNRPSLLSTQAAMLLAQTEFQESSEIDISSSAHRPWSQSQRDTTPRSMLPEPSPAITPLALFSAKLDQPLLNQSVPRGPLMSTQDLFGAASPFAFSTVKKHTDIRRRSGLKIALDSSDDTYLRTNASPGQSPAPMIDRIPLKVKNISTPLWSFISEKASQESFSDGSRQPRRGILSPLPD